MFKILHRYKAIGVDGVSSFVYWDTFESDKSDELSKLKTFVGIVHNVGLKWIPRLSFHDFDHFPQVVKEFITSGNNNIDLSNYSYNDSVDGSNAKKSRSPDNESNSKSNGYYRCLYGLDMNNANFYYKHSISLMCDDLKPFNGNSALDLYYSFFEHFSENFKDFRKIIEYIQIGLGPEGYLAYPSTANLYSFEQTKEKRLFDHCGTGAFMHSYEIYPFVRSNQKQWNFAYDGIPLSDIENKCHYYDALNSPEGDYCNFSCLTTQQYCYNKQTCDNRESFWAKFRNGDEISKSYVEILSDLLQIHAKKVLSKADKAFNNKPSETKIKFIVSVALTSLNFDTIGIFAPNAVTVGYNDERNNNFYKKLLEYLGDNVFLEYSGIERENRNIEAKYGHDHSCYENTGNLIDRLTDGMDRVIAVAQEDFLGKECYNCSESKKVSDMVLNRLRAAVETSDLDLFMFSTISRDFDHPFDVKKNSVTNELKFKISRELRDFIQTIHKFKKSKSN